MIHWANIARASDGKMLVNMESGVRWPKSVWDGGFALKRMEREMELIIRFEIISRGLASSKPIQNGIGI